jgi:Family of unknown function (DUF6499)
MKRTSLLPNEETAALNFPDWRDASQYQAKLPPDGWAWEFLRRNVSYRADYSTTRVLRTEFNAAAASTEWNADSAVRQKHFHDQIRQMLATWHLEIPSGRYIAPRRKLDDLHPFPAPSARATDRFSPAEFTQSAKLLVKAFRYDAQDPLDPNRVAKQLASWILRPGEIALLFNCGSNLEAQIDQAIKEIRVPQKNLKTNGYEVSQLKGGRDEAHLRQYLRVLDGFAVGCD